MAKTGDSKRKKPESTTPIVSEIRRVLLGRHPLIYVVTPEEERASASIVEAATSILGDSVEVLHWSVTHGLHADGKKASKADTVDPARALDHAAKNQGTAVYIFKDLHLWMGEREIVRGTREVYNQAVGRNVHLFLVSPLLRLPLEIKKDVAVIDMPPPSLPELEPVLDEALEAAAKAGGEQTTLDDAGRMSFLRALQGLTWNEARHVLARVLAEHGANEDGLKLIQQQKARLIRKEGVVEFVPQQIGIEDVGGLEILKDWLQKRRKLFFDDPEKVGDLMPRGLMMMGVSGCGKSLSVKAISGLWDLPLFRLDMNEVFSGAHGTPEDSFVRALRASEAFAPCILWIDEIEGGITGYEASHGGSTWRIFSTFLTWMQEKTAPVFVAATANRIDLLPAEILRKGRFDQIFFIDLPSEQERAEIFEVHLKARGADLTQFDTSILARGAKGWNGAEIEQCVVAAMVEAYSAGQELNKDHLYEQLSNIVPLSTTMSEQIKAIRSWAHDRALKAGR